MPLENDPLLELGETSEELFKLLRRETTDTAVVILGAGMLEDELESVLRGYCRSDTKSVKKFVDPLFDVYAPLSTFSAKINICYALGLVDEKTRKTADLIRKLRNDFAHERKVVSFQTPKYESRLKEIVSNAKKDDSLDDYSREAVRVYGSLEHLTPISKRELCDRAAFCLSVTFMSGRIRGMAEGRKLLMSGGPEALQKRLDELG